MHQYVGLSHVQLAAGRRVSVALTNQVDTVQRLSNSDARPFVPPSLRTLFDTPPATFIAELPPLSTLMGSRYPAHPCGRLTSSPASD